MEFDGLEFCKRALEITIDIQKVADDLYETTLGEHAQETVMQVISKGKEKVTQYDMLLIETFWERRGSIVRKHESRIYEIKIYVIQLEEKYITSVY
jgi:hypothetical protein